MTPDDYATCARLWPHEPWPDAVIATELITALARVGAYRSVDTDPPF